MSRLGRACCCLPAPHGECCPGWLHMDNEPPEIQRCDACRRFETDEDAAGAHRDECGCNFTGDQPGTMPCALTAAEVAMIVEALDSHEYWQLSDPNNRNSGYVIDDPKHDDPETLAAIRFCRALAGRLGALQSGQPDSPLTKRGTRQRAKHSRQARRAG